jgi:hypothetical protein
MVHSLARINWVNASIQQIVKERGSQRIGQSLICRVSTLLFRQPFGRALYSRLEPVGTA